MDSKPTDRSQWPDLPLDILLKIASFLTSRPDRLRLRSVCKSWRASIPKPASPKSLLDNIPTPFPDSNLRRQFDKPSLILSERPIYHISYRSRRRIRSSVIGIEELRNGKLQARHPISGKCFGRTGIVLDLTKVHVLQVSKSFHLKCGSFYYSHVVAALDNDVRVMIISGEKLLHFRSGDKEWVTINNNGKRFPYSDLIYWKGKFYAVDEVRRLVIVDNDLNVEIVNSPDVLSAGLMSNSDTSYLVDFNGELYLLVLYYGAEDDIRDPLNTKFLLYRFEEAERDWIRVMSLGDWSIFVSRYGSFTFRVPEMSSCQKNCIYFQVGSQAGTSSFENKVCFIAAFDVEKRRCQDVAYDYDSSGALISQPLQNRKF